MAIAIIQIQDLPNGVTDVRLIAEPAIKGGETEFTTAQKMAAVALNAIQGALEQESPIVMAGGASKLFVPS